MAGVLEISQAEWQTVPGPNNTLVIPSQYKTSNPIVPQGTTGIEELVQSDCSSGPCTMYVHSSLSGFWYPLYTLSDCSQTYQAFNTPPGCGGGSQTPCEELSAHDVFAAVAATFQKSGPDQPAGYWQAQDPLGGNPIFFPPSRQFSDYPPGANFSQQAYDFWTIACRTLTLNLDCSGDPCPPGTSPPCCAPPGLFCNPAPCAPGWMPDPAIANCCIPAITPPPPPAPFWCQPPGVVTVLSNGATVCMFDPPIPNHLPLALRGGLQRGAGGPGVFPPRERALDEREAHQIARARAEFASSFLALDPTRRLPIPVIMKSCGCEDDDFIDEVIGA